MHSGHEPSDFDERAGYALAKLYAIQDTIGRFILAVQWLGIAYIAYLAIDSLAGKTTVFDATFEYIARHGIGTVSSWIVAVGAVGWAWRERRIRLRMERAWRRAGDGADIGSKGGTES